MDSDHSDRHFNDYIQFKTGIPGPLEHVTQNGGKIMTIIMILYYIICIYVTAMLLWNFIREKKSLDNMLHYLLVMIPLILRVFRIK